VQGSEDSNRVDSKYSKINIDLKANGVRLLPSGNHIILFFYNLPHKISLSNLCTKLTYLLFYST